MEVERYVTISYLARISGVKDETIRRYARELLSIIENDPSVEASK